MGGAKGRVRGFFRSHLKLVAGSAVVGLGVSAALATYKLSKATISFDNVSLGLNQQLETLTLIAVAKKGT